MHAAREKSRTPPAAGIGRSDDGVVIASLASGGSEKESPPAAPRQVDENPEGGPEMPAVEMMENPVDAAREKSRSPAAAEKGTIRHQEVRGGL